jgi:hypothetical protein
VGTGEFGYCGVCEGKKNVVETKGEVDGGRDEEYKRRDKQSQAIGLRGIVGSGVRGLAAEPSCVGA